MIQSDEQWLALADEFYNAAVDPSRWYGALDALAHATGSRSGQLITIGADAAIPINIMTNLDPEAHDAFVMCNGGDPNINPRVAAGIRAPLLEVLAEADFLTPDQHARHPHYDEFARPWDIPFICLSTLERRNGLLIGLAVLRSEHQGHIGAKERRVFATLAPHVRAAVRMQFALGDHGTALIKGTFETLGVPAFICGHNGFVHALTPEAEVLARSGRGLQIRNQRLRAARELEDKILLDAIAKACIGLSRPKAPVARSIVIHGPFEDSAPMAFEVMPLPIRAIDSTTGPRAIVIGRSSSNAASRKAAILQTVYGLTAAETDIALQLAEGKAAEAIATDRNVAIGTVRAQIKSVLAKLRLSRQIELVARLSEL